ncbi:MAG: hypothetical protein WCM76_15345 [Bacteroidota bacterium]
MIISETANLLNIAYSIEQVPATFSDKSRGSVPSMHGKALFATTHINKTRNGKTYLLACNISTGVNVMPENKNRWSSETIAKTGRSRKAI